MRAEPQAEAYAPEPQILSLADWLGDQVAPATFPQATLRWRNDRWARGIGLDALTDAQWTAHFGRFAPLPGNLEQPLALRYHGHQFGVFNPDLGDGRGFLFAQMRGCGARLMDLGTKGSGTTPWSRQGDGRLTLKGGVREILATEMLEALGANTSRTFSLIETGEALWRGDEPSPTRSAVMVRLSHGHIRIGTFQRLLVLEEAGHMAELVDYCLAHYPGPPPPDDAPGRDEPAVILLHQVVDRLADMAASYVVAGFVHGVLNTDNMNITGESFDYGPWRWLPRWEAGFTAAYFDHAGRYAFGQQAGAIKWNCGQLAVALRALTDAPPLIAALDRFDGLYHAHLARRLCWRLGVVGREGYATPDTDAALMAACGAAMKDNGIGPDTFFHAARGGRAEAGSPLAEALFAYAPLPGALEGAAWHGPPPSNHIDEVERIWAAIDTHDDWQPLMAHVAAIRALGDGLGTPPAPSGHIATGPVTSDP
ncbi:YdiU family protein [Novosphingobium sp. FSY-8]|uniref:YdiU family protein n=1 Tax=Novosphingobium ovatum TaxID=1908523 RepID=A0ABW9XBD5_9SPHN|nr:YdiU family protein [Novosphingobium ovatum]NBC35839.1 YdiU family protein [Novosphingobium ovatum]